MSDSEGSDYEEANDINLGKLSSTDFDRVRKQLSEKCSAVNAYFLSSREPVDKRRLIESTLQDLLNAFNKTSAAYLQLNASTLTASKIRGAIKTTVKDQVAATLKDLLPTMPTPGSRTYAEATLRAMPVRMDSRRVKVSNGPTVIVPSTVSVVIGPKADNAHKFVSADATRKAVMSAVKPSDVNLKINKLVNIRNNSVRVIAENIDIAKLKSSTDLAAAGLEIKERERLNPRLVIRGVPKDTSSTDLLADILSLNFEGELQTDSIKVVYRYPPRANSNVSSVVIETGPDVRRRLLSQGRVYLPWQSCKVEDHLRVLQCYKCQGFGHLAKGCTSSAVCGNCTGAHETPSCSSGTVTIKCHNCSANKLASTDHKAFDTTKCSIIKRRLTEKARNICY